ncbi:MAG TPA: phospholipase C, phosphocholine-specific [Polyangiaceae bacterium]|nr:phospholipase C, phosphocholine-specific [Polyangiaceae bacterium]
MSDDPRNKDARHKVGRRGFLSRAGAAGAAFAGAQLLPSSIRKALAVPAACVTGTIRDVQHVVILMQENRSFDHYFGTLPGVRGFGDRTAIPLPNGKPVWYESDGTREILPFHLDTTTTTAMRVPGTPHTWPDAQLAWDQGRFGEWARHKNFPSMGYYQEADIPFQRALADAFTLCDAHHCSIQTGTLPNRVVFMTGTNVTPGRVTPGTTQAEALIDNQNNRGQLLGLYSWTTYPERLQAAGVSWRVYQDPLDNWGGLLAPWESFQQYQQAAPGEPLFERAMTNWSLADLAEHVSTGTLPQVSWVIPSPVWSEHPSASSPLQGASFAQQVLDILVSNPELWSQTVFIITFDENDGLFDHVPPPAVPSLNPDGTRAGKTTLSTPLDGEYYDSEIAGVAATRPYGLGPRVPMYVISPWSRGGWVCSETFDHTSTIRFLEARFGVYEPNITPWHRAVCGDLTSCFDFEHPNDAELPELPDMSAATGETLVIEGLPPVSVPEPQQLPEQAPGVRYARALPYVLHAHARESESDGRVDVTFQNLGRAGVVFHVYDRLHLDRFPCRYTVEASKGLTDAWLAAEDAAYDLLIIGPNGFLREIVGVLGDADAAPEVELEYHPRRRELELRAWNDGSAHATIQVTTDGYPGQRSFSLELPCSGEVVSHRWSVARSGDWYDFSVRCGERPSWLRRFAGRMETGRHGVSDPAPRRT